MAGRSGWSGLSEGYRSRLIGAGRSGKLAGRALSAEETRRYWESGADLRTGRSHAFGAKRPRGAAPKKATDLEMRGKGTPESYSELVKWRKKRPSAGGPPSWIPKDETELRSDTAAILSQIDIPPARWAKVDLIWLAPSGPVAMQITSKRGAKRTVILPDNDAVKEVGRLLREIGPDGLEVVPHGSPGAKAPKAAAA